MEGWGGGEMWIATCSYLMSLFQKPVNGRNTMAEITVILHTQTTYRKYVLVDDPSSEG